MGFWSGLGSLVSSAINMVSSVAGSLGGLAATALKTVGPFLGPIGQIVSIIATVLGVFKKDDNVEELGAKAMQSDKKPEDFASHSEYIDHLRNDIELDKKKFEEAGPAEKLARTAMGTTIAMKGIDDAKGFETPIETYMAMAKLGLGEKNADEINTLIDTFKDGKLEDFAKYVDDKLDMDTDKEIGDTLEAVYKELEPNSSQQDIEDKVMGMKVGDIEPPKSN